MHLILHSMQVLMLMFDLQNNKQSFKLGIYNYTSTLVEPPYILTSYLKFRDPNNFDTIIGQINVNITL